MSFYRPPVNPGWDDFGARVAQGVQAGIGLYHDLRERQRTRQVEDDARVQQERMHGIVPQEDVPSEDYAELVPTPVAVAAPTAAQGPGVRFPVAGASAGGTPGLRYRAAGAVQAPGIQYAEADPARAAGGIRGAILGGTEALAPRLAMRRTRRRVASQDAGGGKRYVRDLDVGLQNTLLQNAEERRAAGEVTAAVAAQRQALEDDQRAERTSGIVAALTGQGYTPAEANRLALAAEYHVPVQPTPSERASQRREDLELEDTYRRRQEDRRFSHDLSLRAASGGAGRPVTPAEARAQRKEAEGEATATAYRIIRSDPTISDQEAFDQLRQQTGGRVSAAALLDRIAEAQRQYGKEQGSNANATRAEAARRRAADQRQIQHGRAPGTRKIITPRSTTGSPSVPARAPAPAAAGGGAAKPSISAAEAAALRARGYNDQQIRQRYQVQR